MTINGVKKFLDEENSLNLDENLNHSINALKIKNRLTHIDEIENLFLNLANESNKGYISEQGEVERWVGGIDKKEFTKNIKEAANTRRKHLKKELNDEKRA